jgi:hypothetical protein
MESHLSQLLGNILIAGSMTYLNHAIDIQGFTNRDNLRFSDEQRNGRTAKKDDLVPQWPQFLRRDF